MLELSLDEMARECYLEIRSKLLLDEGCCIYQQTQTTGFQTSAACIILMYYIPLTFSTQEIQKSSSLSWLAKLMVGNRP